MKYTLKIFVMEGCPYCTPVKRDIKNLKIENSVIDLVGKPLVYLWSNSNENNDNKIIDEHKVHAFPTIMLEDNITKKQIINEEGYNGPESIVDFINKNMIEKQNGGLYEIVDDAELLKYYKNKYIKMKKAYLKLKNNL